MPEFRIDVRGLGIEDVIKDAIEDDGDLVDTLTNVDRHDPRAEYVDESFEVESVELLEGSEVRVQYRYEWHAHYGCQDLSPGGMVTEEVTGHIENGQLVFDIELPEARSTADEL
jgi:hypothetical protein